MLGIKYTGSFQDSTGYGSANRAFIASLYMAGLNVTTDLVVTQRERSDLGWEGKLATQLQDRKIPYAINVIHLTPDLAVSYLEKDKYNILHLFWETDRLPIGWADHCNKFAEVWASSPHMAELFKKSGVIVPVNSFPQPIDISWAEKDIQPYKVPHHKGILFYAMFQWIDRKNPKGLIKAYWEAFEGHENVSLLIKTFRLNYEEQEVEKIKDDIRMWKLEMGLKHYPRLLLSTDLKSQEDTMAIHATGDIFISPHRGEGWGRPIAEALLMGKPVIATARGGIHEYLRDEHYFPVDSLYVPVTEVPYIKFYTKDQMWAEPDLKHLIKTMRFVYDKFDLCKIKAKTAQSFIKEEFNYFKVGLMIRNRIETIYKSL